MLLWYLIQYEDNYYLDNDLNKTLNIRQAFYFSTRKEAAEMSKTLDEKNHIIKLYTSK